MGWIQNKYFFTHTGILLLSFFSLSGFSFFDSFRDANSVEGESIIFETDSRKTLGTLYAKNQEVALPFLSQEDLSKKLGYQNYALASKDVATLAERVAAGYLPTGWKQRCATENSPALCSTLEEYFSQSPGFIEKSASRSKRKQIPFQMKYISSLQEDDLASQLSRAPDWTYQDIVKFSKKALTTQSCPRSFSLTLARKFERYADSNKAWDLFEKLESHGLECLKADNPNMEFQWLRRGLLMLAREKFTESLEAFEKALSSQKKREESRTLYWYALLNEKLGQKDLAAKLRDRLFTNFPLSWFTVLAKIQLGLDPIDYFKNKETYKDAYATFNSDSSEKSEEKKVLWLQLLIAEKRYAFAASKYGDYVVKSSLLLLSPGVVQHLARLFDHNALYRLQIVALNQLVQQKPENITAETLRLLYPKPFFEDIDKHSLSLDSALLLGLARQESSFDPFARSTANAQGLMQLLPSTAKGLVKKNKKASKGQKNKNLKPELYNYAKNIELGSRFVMKLIKLFDGSAEKALAAYNAGQGNVRKWENSFGFAKDPQLFMDLIPFRETREYVPSILRNAYWYHRLFPHFGEKLKDAVMTSQLLREQLEPVKEPRLPLNKDEAPSKNSEKEV